MSHVHTHRPGLMLLFSLLSFIILCGYLDVSLRGPLLERMPVLDLASYTARYAGIDRKDEDRSVSPADRTFTTGPSSTELTTNHLLDMLTIKHEDHPSPLSASTGDALLDIIGGSSRPTTASSSTPGNSTSSVFTVDWQGVSFLPSNI